MCLADYCRDLVFQEAPHFSFDILWKVVCLTGTVCLDPFCLLSVNRSIVSVSTLQELFFFSFISTIFSSKLLSLHMSHDWSAV